MTLHIILQDKGIQKDKSGIYSCFEHMCTHMFQLHIDDVTQQVGSSVLVFCCYNFKNQLSHDISLLGTNEFINIL